MNRRRRYCCAYLEHYHDSSRSTPRSNHHGTRSQDAVVSSRRLTYFMPYFGHESLYPFRQYKLEKREGEGRIEDLQQRIPFKRPCHHTEYSFQRRTRLPLLPTMQRSPAGRELCLTSAKARFPVPISVPLLWAPIPRICVARSSCPSLGNRWVMGIE